MRPLSVNARERALLLSMLCLGLSATLPLTGCKRADAEGARAPAPVAVLGALAQCRPPTAGPRATVYDCGAYVVLEEQVEDEEHERVVARTVANYAATLMIDGLKITAEHALQTRYSSPDVEASEVSLLAELGGQQQRSLMYLATTRARDGARLRWCTLSEFAPSVSYEESMRGCEQLVWALIHGGAPAGVTVAKPGGETRECAGECEAGRSGALAKAIAGFRELVDKACGCGDDEACRRAVHADYKAWSTGAGATRDPGSEAQAMELGMELQRLMRCDPELGRSMVTTD